MSILDDEKQSRILEIINDGVTSAIVPELHSLIEDRITNEEIELLHKKVSKLIGLSIPVLNIPRDILKAFEPSQIGTIVGTVMDACIPQLDSIIENSKVISDIGLQKHEGILGEREGYPDYKTNDGYRLELKLLYVDPVDVEMKKPPTPREASARLTQKVTYKNVDTSKDLLMVVAYQFRETHGQIYSPTIIDVGIFPVIDCILARDVRLSLSPGRWFGNFETPAILSNAGKIKDFNGEPLNKSVYGRKESEGLDFNEDTNFGKLARIPLKTLQEFLKKNNTKYVSRGVYPSAWTIR
ncbi:hypothetical protein [Aeromonas hydrophila]|uniref:hypothetical protein n=1 Tax=Aeromonas hydrophila TaxID=644 RepID=UPI002B49C250|nr:hypothetical protein [Aeromonas hydrophila]